MVTSFSDFIATCQLCNLGHTNSQSKKVHAVNTVFDAGSTAPTTAFLVQLIQHQITAYLVTADQKCIKNGTWLIND